MNEINTLALRTSQLPVTCMADLATAGELLAASGMMVKNAAAGFVVAATCHQQGISLLEFHRTYHIVDGKPSMRADAMLAEFRKAGGRYKITENSVTRAAAEFEFEGQKIDFSFSMQDAMRTGDCLKADGKTIKEIWQKRPEDMLWARMVSRAVRRLCPEINAGLYAPEEVVDFASDSQRPAPSPISVAEAVRRAKPVQGVTMAPATVATAQAVTAAEVAVTDFTLCPIGGEGWEGRPWADMTKDELEAALEWEGATVEGMTPNHYAAIHAALTEKNEAEKQ